MMSYLWCVAVGGADAGLSPGKAGLTLVGVLEERPEEMYR